MNIRSQKRYRLFLIVLAYFLMAMMGIRLGIYQSISIEREYVYTIILALTLTYICIVDSRIVGKPLSIFSYWLIFIFNGIAVPVCIIRARGLRGIGILAVHFIGLMLVYTIACFATYLIVYGI
jgi:hypothetical protein